MSYYINKLKDEHNNKNDNSLSYNKDNISSFKKERLSYSEFKVLLLNSNKGFSQLINDNTHALMGSIIIDILEHSGFITKEL